LLRVGSPTHAVSSGLSYFGKLARNTKRTRYVTGFSKLDEMCRAGAKKMLSLRQTTTKHFFAKHK
jgi:hypothetical protein